MLYTATEVAEQINATKPDFKYFKELFILENAEEVKARYFETLKNSRNSIDEVLNGSI